MFALQLLAGGLSIETRTSKLVTLSFSTPIGEIWVTRPLNVLSLNVSTRIFCRLAEPHAADCRLRRPCRERIPDRCRRASSPAWRFAPRLRIDDHRAADFPRRGESTVAADRCAGWSRFATSSAARSAAAFACANLRARAPRSPSPGLTASCECAAPLTIVRHPRRGRARRRAPTARSDAARRATAPARTPRRGELGRRDLPLRRCSSAAAPARLRAMRARRQAGSPRRRGSAAASCSLSSSTRMSPAFTLLSMSALRALMMPFAFDLISILVIGSTLPVATTDLTMVPRSTVASFAGSTSGRRAFQGWRGPAAPPRISTPTAMPMYRRLRGFEWSGHREV